MTPEDRLLRTLKGLINELLAEDHNEEALDRAECAVESAIRMERTNRLIQSGCRDDELKSLVLSGNILTALRIAKEKKRGQKKSPSRLKLGEDTGEES